MITNFKNDIDLMDETLREGAERSCIKISIEEKLEVAKQLSDLGIKSIVVGMFPDIPHNVELLKELLNLQSLNIIKQDVRFMIISHIGKIMWDTIDTLNKNNVNQNSVWIIAIHSVSDLQLMKMFPTLVNKDPSHVLDVNVWENYTDNERREFSNQYLKSFFNDFSIKFPNNRVMLGLLDSFRANNSHIKDVLEIISKETHINQVRLVDTAGTCTPQILLKIKEDVLDSYPKLLFFGHFHDDFGMATSNAILGLSFGFKGVDVSVGGIANRAGHPALAEVAVALKELYDITIDSFKYESLYSLSRYVERIYGLLESPCKSITGIITHTVQSGIRTELLKKHPKIFDVISPELYGGNLIKMFGIRSGIDGVKRLIYNNANLFDFELSSLNDDLIVEIYNELIVSWGDNTENNLLSLKESMLNYQNTLNKMILSEDKIIDFIKNNFLNKKIQ